MHEPGEIAGSMSCLIFVEQGLVVNPCGEMMNKFNAGGSKCAIFYGSPCLFSE